MSDSSVKSPLRSESVEEIASLIRMSNALKLNNGILVAVPNRLDDDDGADGQRFEDVIESATKTALKEVEEKGIIGRDITPYILDRVRQITGGQSLTTNIRLIHNNAVIGAQIAKSLHSTTTKMVPHRFGGRIKGKVNGQSDGDDGSEVLVVGGCVCDIIGTPHSASNGLVARTSNPGHTQTLYGGTGRNITGFAILRNAMMTDEVFQSTKWLDSHCFFSGFE